MMRSEMTGQTPFRLAMRVEGRNWCAYITKPDTMQGAIFLGSIAMRFVEDNKERKQAFIDLMTGALGEMVEELFGQVPAWEQKPAPESERSGNT
jgi:hypothetical protein